MHSMSDSSLLFNQAIKNINKNGDKRIKKTPNICGKSPNVETSTGRAESSYSSIITNLAIESSHAPHSIFTTTHEVCLQDNH